LVERNHRSLGIVEPETLVCEYVAGVTGR